MKWYGSKHKKKKQQNADNKRQRLNADTFPFLYLFACIKQRDIKMQNPLKQTSNNKTKTKKHHNHNEFKDERNAQISHNKSKKLIKKHPTN